MAEQAVQTVRNAGREELATHLEETIASVRQERFVIGVIGATNRGKSTLINGLLGRKNDDCAPIAMAPATNTISVFGRSATSKTTVWFHRGSDLPARPPEIISESEIRLYATEKHNPGNKKQVRSIEILAPFEDLEEGVFLVDTPGAGNALEKMHAEVLLNFLPNADAVIFMVTGEKPLTDPEKALLSAVRKKDVGKLFFAVNMADRINSGDITPDAFAEGIQHNRKILDSIGMRPKLYRISAKNYYETRSDSGTEELLDDIRETVGKERLTLQAQRLRERTNAVLEACGHALDLEWQEAKAGKEQLSLEIDGLKKAKLQLESGRTTLEDQFRRAWAQAFSKLEDDLTSIRRQMKDEYRDLIEGTSALKIAALNTTIHADVVARFGELLEPKMRDCETTILSAQKRLASEVRITTLRAAPQLERIATPLSQAQGAMEIALASLPAVATGTLAGALPGWVGGMIISTAPAVATATWSPFTWLPFLATSGANTVVTGLGAGIAGTLSVVAAPVCILAFGLGIYRGYQAWSHLQNKNKNTLAEAVREQIEEAYGQVQPQLRACKEKDLEILAAFHQALEREFGVIEERLTSLLRDQPGERDLLLLEERHRAFAAGKPALLSAAESESKGEADGGALVDALI